MTQREFINHVLINEIGDIVDHHKWLSFGLICSGIEFLGACIDRDVEQINTGGRSEKRFNNAIKELFPKQYHPFIGKPFNLYGELRCGMNHVLLSGFKIALSERKNSQKNLSTWNDRTIIIAEDFYDDFKNACNTVISMIENGQVTETFKILT